MKSSSIIAITVAIAATLLLQTISVDGAFSVTSIFGSPVSVAGGLLDLTGTDFISAGLYTCSIVSGINHYVHVYTNTWAECIIGDEGTMGTSYTLTLSSSGTVLATISNGVTYASSLPVITSVFSMGSANIADGYYPNCGYTLDERLTVLGSYMPSHPSLYKWEELKRSDNGVSLAVASVNTGSGSPQWDAAGTNMGIKWDMNKSGLPVLGGTMVDMFLSWGTGSGYTRVDDAIQICYDGSGCGSTPTSDTYCPAPSLFMSMGVNNTLVSKSYLGRHEDKEILKMAQASGERRGNVTGQALIKVYSLYDEQGGLINVEDIKSGKISAESRIVAVAYYN